MTYIDELVASMAPNVGERPDKDRHYLIAACAEVDRLRARLAACEGKLAARKENGERMFPGFSLRESPHRVQRLGFSWIDQKQQHRSIEFANIDTHPMMVANQLRVLAEALEEAHTDSSSPLGRAARESGGGK